MVPPSRATRPRTLLAGVVAAWMLTAPVARGVSFSIHFDEFDARSVPLILPDADPFYFADRHVPIVGWSIGSAMAVVDPRGALPYATVHALSSPNFFTLLADPADPPDELAFIFDLDQPLHSCLWSRCAFDAPVGGTFTHPAWTAEAYVSRFDTRLVATLSEDALTTAASSPDRTCRLDATAANPTFSRIIIRSYRAGASVPAGCFDQFTFVPVPATPGVCLLGLGGVFAARRRRGT